VTVEQLGNSGEFIAALTTIVTLVYLAFQLRQNTRVLKATAFQAVVGEMGRNVENIIGDGELAEIIIKAQISPDDLSPVEQLRMNGAFVGSIRRLEAVYVQFTLGTMEEAHKQGFENSIVPMLLSPYGQQWWGNAKSAFYPPFVEHIDNSIESGRYSSGMPTMGYGAHGS